MAQETPPIFRFQKEAKQTQDLQKAVSGGYRLQRCSCRPVLRQGEIEAVGIALISSKKVTHKMCLTAPSVLMVSF